MSSEIMQVVALVASDGMVMDLMMTETEEATMDQTATVEAMDQTATEEAMDQTATVVAMDQTETVDQMAIT